MDRPSIAQLPLRHCEAWLSEPLSDLDRDFQYGSISTPLPALNERTIPVGQPVPPFRHVDGRSFSRRMELCDPVLRSLVTPTVSSRDTRWVDSAPHRPRSVCVQVGSCIRNEQMVTPSGLFPPGLPSAAALGASKNSHYASFALMMQSLGASASRGFRGRTDKISF